MHCVGTIAPCKTQQVKLTGVKDADRAVTTLL